MQHAMELIVRSRGYLLDDPCEIRRKILCSVWSCLSADHLVLVICMHSKDNIVHLPFKVNSLFSKERQQIDAEPTKWTLETKWSSHRFKPMDVMMLDIVQTNHFRSCYLQVRLFWIVGILSQYCQNAQMSMSTEKRKTNWGKRYLKWFNNKISESRRVFASIK